jgi:hypothetical protein
MGYVGGEKRLILMLTSSNTTGAYMPGMRQRTVPSQHAVAIHCSFYFDDNNLDYIQ